MSRASFSTCSTSRLDTSGIDRYSDKDFNELHTFEINDGTNVTPYKKQECEKENNYLTANLSSSIEKWENIPKSTLNEYDGDGRLIDDNSELLGGRKDEHSRGHSRGHSSGGDYEVEQGRENIMQYNTVNDNTSNNNACNHDKINDDNDNHESEDKEDINRIDSCKKENYRNASNDNTDDKIKNVKSLMNINEKIPENNFTLTDFTANGIIRPVYINENDDIINIDSIDTKMKIDGIIIGDYNDSKDDHDSYHNNDNNDNNDNDSCDKNTHNYGNSNHNNNDNNDNDNKSDVNDDDDDENGWTSMPSSHDLTTTLETIISKEKKEKNENKENNENSTSKVIKEKKTEKIRNKKKLTKNSIENENENKNENRTQSKKIIMKNINIDERTYDLYSDGTHSKILAYRFERVLLVETFKENAGN
jgi:hypothetical protein